MTEYTIYTTNDSEPFIVNTDEDLQEYFKTCLTNMIPYMEIKHTKKLMSGVFNYDVVLNVDQIVSISTREKLE
jgi:hypothetical protein